MSWTEHITNREVLRKAGSERSLLNTIRKQQLKFLGHIMRKEGLENLTLTGQIEGKRSRGRQRLIYLEGLNNWVAEQMKQEDRPSGMTKSRMLSTTRDRKLWRTMKDMVPRERERLSE